MIKRQNDTGEGVVLAVTTFADADVARQIGTQMVELQLVACVNILPGVESIYRWNGDVEVEGECLMLMKTTRDGLEKLESWILTHHPYEVPEFLVIPVEAGAEAYLAWVGRNVLRES